LVTQKGSNIAQYTVGTSHEKTWLQAGISATMPLYNGGLSQNKLKIANIQLDSAKETSRKSKQQLVYNVKQTYYNVWLADQVLQVQQSSYNNMQHHVARIEALYKVGTASKFDLLRAQVQRDTLKPKVISAQNQLVLAKLQLATTIDLPKDRAFMVQYDVTKLNLPQAATQNLQKVLEEADQSRPELRQLRQGAEIKKIQTVMVKNSFKPVVDLTASFGGVNKTVALDDWYTGVELVLSVKGKVYDRSVQTQIDQATGSEELTAIQEANLRDQIRLDAEQSLQNLEVGIETTVANQANLELAKESPRMTQARFDNGMSTTMDIMDAQLALDQAYSGYYQGVVTYLIAEAKIDLVTGKD
jgi:outer membrane protein TolC